MSGSRALTVARWVLATIFVVGMVLGSLLSLAWANGAWVFVPAALGYGLVGLVITGHRPQNPVGWVFLGAGASYGLFFSATAASVQLIPEGGDPPWSSGLLALLGSVTGGVFLLMCTTFTLLLYPEGLPSRRWRPVLWLGGAAAAAMAAGNVFASPVTIPVADDGIKVANPLFGDDLVTVQSWIGQIGGTVLFACSLAGLVSAVLRTWRSTGVQRMQMRWFAASVALVLFVPLLSALVGGDWNVTALAVAITLPCVPVSCGVAILRYRLYEIDRIISRTLSYALVTGLLLAVYAVIVTSVTQLLPGTSNTFAVASATLAAAAAFRPIFRRVQGAVDRRFNRGSYNAHQTVETFAARLRDEVDPDEVSADLLAVLNRTVEPRGVALWVKDGS